MKHIINTVLFLFSLSVIFAQGGGSCTFDKDVWSSFKNAKLSIVLDGAETYNKEIKSAVESNWTFNPYEFISIDDFQKTKLDTSKYFLIIRNISYREVSNNMTTNTTTYYTVSHKALVLIKGNKNLGDNFSERGEIPVGYKSKYILSLTDVKNYELFYNGKNTTSNTEKDFLKNSSEYYSLFIRSINWYSTAVYSKNIKNLKNYRAVMITNKKNLKNRTLYILEDDLNEKFPNEASVKKKYPNEVHVINKTQLRTLIQKKTEGYIFYYQKYGQDCLAKVYNIKTGEPLLRKQTFPQYSEGIDPYILRILR